MKKIKWYTKLLPLGIVATTIPVISSCSAFPDHSDEVVRFIDYDNAESITITVDQLDHEYFANFKVLHDQATQIEYSHTELVLKQDVDLHIQLKQLEGQTAWQCTFHVAGDASAAEISTIIQIKANFINGRGQKCTSYCFITVEKAKQPEPSQGGI